MPKKLFIWSITNVDTKDWFWKYEIAFFCVYYPRCTLLLLFSYKAQYFISIISILTYRTTGISASFLKIPNWCFSNCIYTISYKRYTRYLTSIERQCLNSWCRIYLCASKNMLKFSISQTNNFITSCAWEMWTGSCQLSTQNLANGWLSFQLGLKFKDQDWLNLWI